MSANIKNININRSYLHAGGATENTGTQQQMGVQNNGNPINANTNNGVTNTLSPQNFNIANTTPTDGYSVSSSGTSISDASSITSGGDESSSEGKLGIFPDPPQKGGDEDELDSMDGGASTVSTAEILAKDPLFLVLSEFFMDEKGNTIVHTLSKVAKNIEKLNAGVEKLCKTIEKSNKKE